MRGLIVGTGSIGRRHLRNLRHLLPDAEIIVLRHRQLESSDTGLSDADQVIFRLEDAWVSPLDFAIVASPAPFHLEKARQLAERGVHLLLEKPISNDLSGVDDLIATCRARRLTLLIGYTMRFDRPLRAVRRAVGEGRIGRVLGFRAEVGQYLPDWRAGVSYRDTVTARRALGGGVLLELSHELDSARWLVGDVAAVSAVTARVSDLEIDVEDWADLNLQFRCGAFGHIHLDMVQRAPTRSCRIIGSDGTITWDAFANQARLYSAANQEWQDLHAAGAVDRNEKYVDELRHFLACVRGEEQPTVTGEDGKRALEIALAAGESARTGKSVEIGPVER